MPEEIFCPEGFLENLRLCFEWDCFPSSVFREKIWQDPDYDPALCLLAVKDGAWRGIAMAVIRNRSGQKHGYLKLIAVADGHRNQGWGKALVEELISRLWLAGAVSIRLGESAPNYLSPGLDPRYTSALVLFEEVGFKPIGHTFHLEVNLIQDVSDFASELSKINTEGITLRRALTSDCEKMMDFLEKHWPSWQEEVIPALQTPCPPVFLAWKGKHLVGFAGFDCNNKGVGWFGPMGTSPSMQGKGIGKGLLLAVLLDMESRGYGKAIIPWVGPVRFYHKAVGASISQTFIRMELKRPEGWKPE